MNAELDHTEILETVDVSIGALKLALFEDVEKDIEAAALRGALMLLQRVQAKLDKSEIVGDGQLPY